MNQLAKFVKKNEDRVWALFFFAVAAFFSYSPMIAPDVRFEMVIASAAAGVGSAYGVPGLLLAFAKGHSDSIGELTNDLINAVEKATGKNIVPNDIQTALISAEKNALQSLKVSASVMDKLAELERKVNDLMPRG